MGAPRIKNFEEKFLERGLIPLEPITNAKQKVPCIDLEGYKYFLSYRGSISDKRTKQFDKWDKTNPFKAYNMRLFASRMQENCIILSTDEELNNASKERIKFICPNCGKEYIKKWCHWIIQPLNHHFCPECNDCGYTAGNSQYSVLTEKWLNEHSIPFIKEKTFEDCRMKRKLRFDFYVENWNGENIVIEVDGMQHFYLSTWTDELKLKDNQERDRIKNEYCDANGIKLVRIPYWLFRSSTYSDILYETFFG